MSKQGITRRTFFTTTATAVGVTAAAGAILGACGGKSSDGPSCEPTGLSLADQKTRTMNKYVSASDVKGKNCANCQLFKPGKDPKGCGKCTVIKGTVSPNGHCQLWAEKKA